MTRLKFLRLTRGLRQEQVAAIIAVPRPHISQFENGVRNPNGRQLTALARLFNCPPDQLLDHVMDGGAR